MADGPVPLPPVSTTAVGVAAIRAAESAMPNPLFVDPLAPAFVRAARTSRTVDRDDSGDRRRVGALIFWIRVRTRFLDDVVTRACADGCRQFVVLGAGLDARAFRLPFPAGIRFFEVDLPDVLTFKERVVADGNHQPLCERVVVPTDLAGPWTDDLDRAGFDPGRRTTWLAEGLLAYLTEGTREAVVDAVTERSVPRSHFGLTIANAERVAGRHNDPGTVPSQPGDYVALWQSDPPADADAWLGGRGWSVEELDAVDRAAVYGLDVTRRDGARTWARLVDATRT
jgi:methyltransferase (TIGR00027 family)